MAEALALAIENQLQLVADGLKNKEIISLYKLLKTAIMKNEQFFLCLSDRKEFFKEHVYKPATLLGKELALVNQEPSLLTLKVTKLLLEIALIAVTMTGFVRNRFVFTLHVIDNQSLANLLNVFCVNI
jgi:hypothetical protein